MKNSKWLLVVLVILVGLSCGKNKIEDIDDTADNEGMLSLNVSPDFDWSMSTTYDLVFTGGSFGVIEITSADESVVYHRGSYIEGQNGTYHVNLKLASNVKDIKVNSRAISLIGSLIDIDLSALKAGSVLKASHDFDGDGVDDGDDDYPSDPFRAYDVFWPSTEWTLVFEDIWPSFGDYDFNDLVVGYQFKTVKSATNRVVEIFSYTNVRANGAWLANGYGFELPYAVNGLLTDLSIIGYNHSGSVVTLASTGLEAGQTNPTVIVFDNTTNVMGEWVNTIEFYQTESPVMITVSMTPSGDYEESDFNLNQWNPFIFIGQNRGHELHLANYPPTTLGSSSYFQTFNDSSVAISNRYYVSGTNLPWVLDIPATFAYPLEQINITAAYLHFRDWAEGSSDYDPWYGTTHPNYTEAGWRNILMIYNP